eukprot:scaffold990_cov393-Prasinococcus_capsulatus_cf.AAC.39
MRRCDRAAGRALTRAPGGVGGDGDPGGGLPRVLARVLGRPRVSGPPRSRRWRWVDDDGGTHSRAGDAPACGPPRPALGSPTRVRRRAEELAPPPPPPPPLGGRMKAGRAGRRGAQNCCARSGGPRGKADLAASSD